MHDFDKLRKGRITTRAFRSALSMCGINLSLPEYRALELRYAVPSMNDYVNYVRFSHDIDTVFGDADLHKNPIAESTQVCNFTGFFSFKLVEFGGLRFIVFFSLWN